MPTKAELEEEIVELSEDILIQITHSKRLSAEIEYLYKVIQNIHSDTIDYSRSNRIH